MRTFAVETFERGTTSWSPTRELRTGSCSTSGSPFGTLATVSAVSTTATTPTAGSVAAKTFIVHPFGNGLFLVNFCRLADITVGFPVFCFQSHAVINFLHINEKLHRGLCLKHCHTSQHLRIKRVTETRYFIIIIHFPIYLVTQGKDVVKMVIKGLVPPQFSLVQLELQLLLMVFCLKAVYQRFLKFGPRCERSRYPIHSFTVVPCSRKTVLLHGYLGQYFALIPLQSFGYHFELANSLVNIIPGSSRKLWQTNIGCHRKIAHLCSKFLCVNCDGFTATSTGNFILLFTGCRHRRNRIFRSCGSPAISQKQLSNIFTSICIRE